MRRKTDEHSNTAAPAGTRERIVDAALRLFRDQGYEATGLADIVRLAGVRSGSLYYFFRTKEDLLLAVLDRYLELLEPVVMQPSFTATPDPIERVFVVLARYRGILEATDCTRGCPIGNLALEMSERSEAVRQKIAANFDGWRAAIRGCFDEAADRLPADVDRDRLATLVLTVMEGGVMQARAMHSLQPYDDSVAMLRDYIGRMTSDG